jgi:spermidine synthase
MKPREILDTSTTPDGERLELAREGDHYVIRIGGAPLMSSRTYGSEQEMARVAAERLGARVKPRVLIGGLGMGFTLRAALDSFGPDAEVTVAELLPPLIDYNRGVLADGAGRPLEDRRVSLFEGDVRKPLGRAGWDVVLLDVDNGPDAFTAQGNKSLYGDRGVALMAGALNPGGVLVVWSAYPDKAFERRLRRVGLHCNALTVRARGAIKKGAKHTLFVAIKK